MDIQEIKERREAAKDEQEWFDWLNNVVLAELELLRELEKHVREKPNTTYFYMLDKLDALRSKSPTSF